MTSAPIVLGSGVGKKTIEGWLTARPQLVDALVEAGARIVVFELHRDGLDADAWCESLRRALAEAAAGVDSSVATPLYVAIVSLLQMREAKVLTIAEGGWALTTARVPRLERGSFLGYFAIGEGGAVFLASEGEIRAAPEEVVLRALR